jgi:GST-like protein
MRLYDVMDRRLEGREYLAGDYSIADIAIFPWLKTHDIQGIDLADYPNVARRFETVAARPAVKRGLEVPASPSRGKFEGGA